ncbi:cartilage intermediate layer protein 2-like [Branchiostoma floridae x Branchiostoma japonicum]
MWRIVFAATALLVGVGGLRNRERPTRQSTPPSECSSWTPWVSRDGPSGSGDYEDLPTIQAWYPGLVPCSVPSAFQARTVGTHIDASQTGEVFSTYRPSYGLVCVNAQQSDGSCMDYEVRFCCDPIPDPVDGMWSTWLAWSTCSQSCGGGTQVRQRQCNNPAPVGGGKSCVGSAQQSRQCSTWACPDCSTTCAVGTMDQTTCECSCRSHLLTATVRNMKNAPLQGATIHYADRPYITLGTTDGTGSIRVQGVCANPVDLLVKKDGYSPIVATTVPATSTSSTVTANMEILVAPIITQHPERRSRLVGQEVTFCCEAHGFPNPNSEDYEWFHNGEILDKSVLGYSNHLTLTNLALDDAGEYKCRANSDAGAAYSESALLQVFGSASGSYDAAPAPEYIKLPADCRQPDGTTLYNVGKCDHRPCVGSSYSSGRCNDTTKYCSTGGTLQAQTIDCGSYTIDVMAISSCECLECGDPVTYVRGVLLGGPSDQPVVNADILVNGVQRGYTSFTGTFTLEIPTNTKRLAVTFKDIYKNFVETTKILNFVEGESVYHRVHIRERAPPVIMSSTQTSSVDLGTVPGAAPIGQLEIPPNAFYTKDGQPYSGTVQASVSFIDPRNLTNVKDMQSDFTFVDQEGQEQQLETFGMFSLDFADASGNDLEVAGVLNIFLNENEVNFTATEPGHEVKLWSLNPETGRWEEESTVTQTPIGKRKKRQQGFTWNGNIRVNRDTFNIDAWLHAGQRCHSKVRVYQDRSALNSSTSQVNNVQVEFLVVNTDLDRGTQRFARFYNARTSASGTGGACVEGWCRPGTVTYVSATMGTTEYDAASELELGFSPLGGYTRGNFNKAFSTTLTSGSSGPSYSSTGWYWSSQSLRDCNNAPISDNHFKFYGHQVSGTVEINTLPYDPTENRLRPNYLSWYPTEQPAQKKSCFMKIKVTGSNDNLRARVVSTVGTHASNLGAHYGLREDGIGPAGAASKGACIEYKCSGDVWTTGTNGQPFRDPTADIDYTFVELNFLRNDGSTANCNRVSVNPSFQNIDTFTTLTVQFMYGAPPPDNTDMSRFRFYDSPNGQPIGIYKSTGGGDISKDTAYQQCLAGISSGAGSTTLDPDKNWLVHFDCA